MVLYLMFTYLEKDPLFGFVYIYILIAVKCGTTSKELSGNLYWMIPIYIIFYLNFVANLYNKKKKKKCTDEYQKMCDFAS